MRVWTLVKILAALGVMAVLAFTGMLAYHITVRPLGKAFEKIVPSPHAVTGEPTDADFVKMVDSAEMPDIDPGEKLYQKSVELIAIGDLAGAREKLNSIINVYPSSSCAGHARHIVGEMNLDEILSTAHPEGKQTHTIKRGDSYLALAAKYHTTLDCILYLNGMTGLKSLQPGEELIMMPLDYRVLIEPQRMAISLWDGGRFICEYPIKRVGSPNKLASQSVTIQSKSGQLDGRTIRSTPAPPKKPAPSAKPKPAEAAAPATPAPLPPKSLQLAKVPLRIAADSSDDTSSPGIFLAPEDFEELFLLTRTGNTVEIRNPAK
ncbi:MAG: LysM peptidoglycan-binding domain-containing protein [Verrucomicrobia bacterium]|nr:LysM peptidoglycan-binding domain-containing protein [Verrucomicrobiota bacterium]